MHESNHCKMSRRLYKHSFRTNWIQKRYEESNLHNRRYYRAFQKEQKKKQGIEMVLFESIDDEQLKQTKRDEKRKEREES